MNKWNPEQYWSGFFIPDRQICGLGYIFYLWVNHHEQFAWVDKSYWERRFTIKIL